MSNYLIAGLGNPGKEYENSRHNVGAWCVKLLASRHGISFKKGKGVNVGDGSIAGNRVALAFTQKYYYNEIGNPLAAVLKRENVPIENLVVVYDDLDLPVGRLRMRPQGSDGGNNGLKSIMAATGSDTFGRLRVGIGRPHDRGVPSWDPDIVKNHVLNPPTKPERKELEAAIERACEAIETLIELGWERAMDRYNRVTEA